MTDLQRAHNVLDERVAERTEELQAEICERQQAEDALREAREFLEAAVAQSPSGILIADGPNVTIRLANQAAFCIRGGERRMLTDIEVSEHAERWQTFRPDGSHYPSEQLPLSRAVLHGETVQDEEVIIRDEEGNDHWVNASAAPIRDAQGRVTAGIVLFNDITRQKQTEAELARTRDSAEAANQSKSEFLANMSHEIRTPMTAILGFSELLLGNVRDPENIDGLKTIRRNGQYLLEIINDILDISKIESGKLTIETIECSPCDLLEDVAALMRVRSSVKGIPLEVEYSGPIPQLIQTDPTRLRQVLINLIRNAIKFTEVGKIRLLARLLDADSPAPKMRFDIVDTGIGMSEQQIERVFEPFVQADTSTTRKFGGTGLGLTISRRLTKMLGGDVSIESTLGEGSVFSVTISIGPLKDVTMIDGPIEAQTLSIQCEKRNNPKGQDNKLQCNILLAEDGPDNQKLISFLLRKAGADVTVADNGQIALDLALVARDEGRPFDVILMDMQMPVLDGYESTDQLRQAGYTGPIIALTAHAMSSDRAKCLDAGCNDYATKPINKASLIALIRSHISPEATPKPGPGKTHDAIISNLTDDDDEMLELVEMFVGELPDRIAAIDNAIEKQDLAEVGRLSHQLKGSAGCYGFPTITDAAMLLNSRVTADKELKIVSLHADALRELCGRAQASL